MPLAYFKWVFVGFAVLAPIGAFLEDFGTPAPEDFGWWAAATLSIVFVGFACFLSRRFRFSEDSPGLSERMAFVLGASAIAVVGCIGLIRLWLLHLVYWHTYTIFHLFCVVWGASLAIAVWLNGRANHAADRMPGTTAPRESDRH